jgi:hypothetical protein
VRVALKLAVAAALLASTWLAIRTIAEQKADGFAGGGTFRLDPAHADDWRHYDALLDELRGWDEGALAARLSELQRDGHLFVAPRLAGNRSAIFVDALGLVRRIYVREDELRTRHLPFPDLDVPEAAQRLFTRIRLAGTLFHELQHYDGLEDEGATYDREIGWYEGLRDRRLDLLEGDDRHWFEWAVASALESAEAAREKATGSPASSES